MVPVIGGGEILHTLRGLECHPGVNQRLPRSAGVVPKPWRAPAFATFGCNATFLFA